MPIKVARNLLLSRIFRQTINANLAFVRAGVASRAGGDGRIWRRGNLLLWYILNGLFCCVPLVRSQVQRTPLWSGRRLGSRVSASECSLRICIDNNNNKMNAGREGGGSTLSWAIWLTGGHALLTAQQGAKHQVPPNCPTRRQPHSRRAAAGSTTRAHAKGDGCQQWSGGERNQVGVATNFSAYLEKSLWKWLKKVIEKEANTL